MSMKEKINVQIDLLKYAFVKAKGYMLSEADALQQNLTETFWSTLSDKIKHGELVVMAVRGEVRTGKSTVVLKIIWEMNKYLVKSGINPNALDNISRYIFSDQTEFLRFINGDERNVALAIDEFNRMASTGLNATTEDALFEHYSDVFAAQYLHRVTASPDVITDKNATIILDVIGKDEQLQIVRCKLIYRDITTKQQMTIGYVDIFVGDLISTWVESGVRDILENKGVKSIEDQQTVDLYKERDFYVAYQIKKYLRMDLLKKHGVRDIRDLEYSVIILESMQELQDYPKVQKIDKELLDLIVDEICKRNKRIYSILTVNEISQRAKAILNLYHKVNQLNKVLRTKKLDADEVMVLRKTIKQVKSLLEVRVEQQEKYAALYKEYMNIA